MFAVANLVHNGLLPWDSGDKGKATKFQVQIQVLI